MKHNLEPARAMDLLRLQMEAWGVQLGLEQLELLFRYGQLLAAYKEANVIGTKDLSAIILDHLLDSLSCASLPETNLKGKLIDVGSGGGLPGIPLGIALPQLSVTLLEAIEKKATFLQYAARELDLPNLNVLRDRAEVAGHQRVSREQYDVAVTRALASLPVVVEYCAPFVRTGGSILSMKGRLTEDELLAGEKAARRLGAEYRQMEPVRLRPELEQKQRHLVTFRKVGATPTGYPRRVGLAKKRPLGQ